MSNLAHVHSVVSPMTVGDVMQQVALIQQVMRNVMVDGEHYGVVPGCGNKKVMLKPGAEKLMMTFRLAPTYETDIIEMSGGHREYRIKCILRHMHTGELIGEGQGAASTMETKFRYRSQDTGRKVPSEYWQTRDPSLLGGQQFGARKVEKEWRIFERAEHDNPADYYNTCLKMAMKRAKVDAIITATAASDIFTQDMEDLEVPVDAVTDQADENKSKIQEPQRKQDSQKHDGDLISDAQRKRFYAIYKNAGLDDDFVRDYLHHEHGIDSSKNITKSIYEEICQWAQSQQTQAS